MQSPILIVENDDDDIDIIKVVVDFLKLERPVEYFRTGDELMEYLKTMSNAPLLIICDVTLEFESGFEVKERISGDQELRYKAVPFVFWSTYASEKQIQEAYDLYAQGFFFKETTFERICETFKLMVDYWERSQHPKQVTLQ